ncbi:MULTISPECIES: cyclic peptide export ABC transporter [Methylosinus]|uniref:Cyclic peptide transporter n=1 Tax=Methylosinus trichosporium (strain ATCC 35070 / NCIMB 11131 / UNIQEM 75 / OB3b) TaxID=595536 RepID=A0A2D2D141_METT3|nr:MULTISPECIES: cyclic peptide export ABC transporter [Methylosinus]ATQ68686.1 cyclic peptide transporter [Methylosinus trichosporium OB3b]OBS53152.1 cyclic peptide transporter [Methylosinus sp. 3S-1]
MRNLNLGRVAAGLLRPYWRLALAAVALGGLGSLATVGILALIDDALKSGSSPMRALGFVLLCPFMIAAQYGSFRANSWIVQNVMADLRKSLVDDILKAPVATIERMQKHRVIVALNHDVEQLTVFVRGLPFLLVSVLTACGCVAYLFSISWRLAGVAALAGVARVLVVRRMLDSAYKIFFVEREARENLQQDFDLLVEGCKELRLNQPRRSGFRERRLRAKIDEVRDLTHDNFVQFTAIEAIESASAFIIIGALLAMQQTLGEPKETLGAFVVAMLFLREPINAIVGYIPMYGHAEASFRQIVKLREDFANTESWSSNGGNAAFSTIALVGVTYAYPGEGEQPPFTLGPIDLELRRGETLFIVGENGSGKTTLVKLLLGLYPPTTGAILVDGAPVGDADRDAYRQRFSAVFFDYCLFDDVAMEAGDADAANDYLTRMELSTKTAIVDGVFSTTALSAGQRKRLALVSAFAEGRPVLVLDEWAAEQDPTFRRAFYSEILPDLKRRGKTLICVSHDDRYFDAADRVIHIKDGKIV